MGTGIGARLTFQGMAMIAENGNSHSAENVLVSFESNFVTNANDAVFREKIVIYSLEQGQKTKLSQSYDFNSQNSGEKNRNSIPKGL